MLASDQCYRHASLADG